VDAESIKAITDVVGIVAFLIFVYFLVRELR